MERSQPKLSILICSVVDRANMLARLVGKLGSQIEQLSADVELLTDVDNREVTIGAKRQRLLLKARGSYVAFIDDDDDVVDDYVELVLQALANDPDTVAIRGLYFLDGKLVKPFTHSVAHKSWYEVPEEFRRPPNHLNPVRRELALASGFPDISYGEDRVYSEALVATGRCLVEAQIEKPIYVYQCRSSKQTDRREKLRQRRARLTAAMKQQQQQQQPRARKTPKAVVDRQSRASKARVSQVSRAPMANRKKQRYTERRKGS